MKRINSTVAADILRRHFRREPRDVQKLPGGLNNFVFEGCVGKEKYVIRISDDPKRFETFFKEQWAVRKARAKGVPTPDILEVGNDQEGMPYMVSRKVAGEPATTWPEREKVIQKLGEYAAIINSIHTASFGHIFNWSKNELSRKQTWKEFLENELNIWSRFEFFEVERILEPKRLRVFRRQIHELEGLKGKPSLTHGDLRLKNVVLNQRGKICAVLDWEYATSNLAPIWELSIALHDLTSDEKDTFLQGYGIAPKEYEKIANAVKVLNLLNYYQPLLESVAAKDKIRLNQLRLRLNGRLDLNSF